MSYQEKKGLNVHVYMHFFILQVQQAKWLVLGPIGFASLLSYVSYHMPHKSV